MEFFELKKIEKIRGGGILQISDSFKCKEIFEFLGVVC